MIKAKKGAKQKKGRKGRKRAIKHHAEKRKVQKLPAPAKKKPKKVIDTQPPPDGPPSKK